MCHTAWCGGQCDECVSWAKIEKEHEAMEPCPYDPNDEVPRSKCGLTATSTKQDSCNKCGYTFNYS